MLDLIAITAGVLAFLSWSGAMCAAGWFVHSWRRRRQYAEANQRLSDFGKAALAAAQRAQQQPTPDAATRRRAQA